ncbi:cytoplasmic tRNA 2-thiolation protein 2 isoform X2 [Carcharodon carcharias]|uniref:cytoplasmic tRNA 2-thiolation protein 2 isoform X2 n=1 Tax=Carcharodon carcharias TaxID=13397 RepID=UPI001B7E8E16|nr:cytoplasmic tRNA 2-thiolation protein 2 isoform X2 [Carcharodon carcharias]
MCEAEEDYTEQPLDRAAAASVAQKCMKCKDSSAVLVIRVGDAFCKSCFKEYFVHKFRAMLGKTRLIFPGEQVLLALSGGPTSSAMLCQVQEGLCREAPKKLRFSPGIVHIDEGAVCGRSLEERRGTLSQLEGMFQASGFPYHMVYLEEVFKLPNSMLQSVSSSPASHHGENYKEAVDGFLQKQRETLIHAEQRPTVVEQLNVTPSEDQAQTKLAQLNICDLFSKENTVSTFSETSTYGKWPFNLTQTEAIKELFSSIKTLTAKEELLQTLRHHLLLHTARIKGYTKIMLGDSCTRLAVKLLTNISLGRGASLAIDTGFSDNRYGDIMIVRPMREYSSKEIAFYNKLFDVPNIFTPALDTKANDKASIHRLTESFVNKLQTDFPSTVSTVYRTSEKLNTACCDLNCTEQMEKCLLCLCAMDTKVEEASAFHATLLSEKLSLKQSPDQMPVKEVTEQPCCGGDGEEQKGKCCGAHSEACYSTGSNRTTDLLSLLCYSCRLTVKDMVSLDLLPQYVLSEAERRKRRAQVREQIQEFLLAPEEETDTISS